MVDHDEKANAPAPQADPAQHPAVERREDDEEDRTGDQEKQDLKREALKTEAEAAAAQDPALNLTKSHATDASATTQATAPPSVRAPDRKWHQKLNPLRWGAVPPVPDERQPSPESTASFLSLVTFNWMGSLMTVRSSTPPRQTPCTHSLSLSVGRI